MFSLQRMGAHGRLARLCAVGGVAATSFALVKVINNININNNNNNNKSH